MTDKYIQHFNPQDYVVASFEADGLTYGLSPSGSLISLAYEGEELLPPGMRHVTRELAVPPGVDENGWGMVVSRPGDKEHNVHQGGPYMEQNSAETENPQWGLPSQIEVNSFTSYSAFRGFYARVPGVSEVAFDSEVFWDMDVSWRTYAAAPALTHYTLWGGLKLDLFPACIVDDEPYDLTTRTEKGHWVLHKIPEARKATFVHVSYGWGIEISWSFSGARPRVDRLALGAAPGPRNAAIFSGLFATKDPASSLTCDWSMKRVEL